jgi:hypothetical protein
MDCTTGEQWRFGGMIDLPSLGGVIFGWIDREGLFPLDYRQFLVSYGVFEA